MTVSENQTQSAIFMRRLRFRRCAASTALNDMATCSEAKAAMAWGVAVAGSRSQAIRSSRSICWRLVTSECGRWANVAVSAYAGPNDGQTKYEPAPTIQLTHIAVA